MPDVDRREPRPHAQQRRHQHGVSCHPPASKHGPQQSQSEPKGPPPRGPAFKREHVGAKRGLPRLRTRESLNCTCKYQTAAAVGDTRGTNTPDPSYSKGLKKHQRPATPALIHRIHTSSSHHTPHQCSDSAEAWIKTGAIHQNRRRTAIPTTTGATRSTTAETQATPTSTQRRAEFSLCK